MDPVWWLLRLEKGAWLRNPVEKRVRRYMTAEAPAETIETLMPKFPLGGKRFIMDTGYLKSLHQDNVTPILTGIRELRPKSFVANDGQEHDIDVVILATGFDVASAHLDLVGREGGNVAEQFVIGQESRVYHGMTVPKFPNYYMMLGPNTAPGHASVIFQIEVQADYITQCVLAMQKNDIKILEVKEAAAEVYDNWLAPRLRSTVWTTASGFYHVNHDKNARITTNWPATVLSYFWQNACPIWADYVGAEELAKKQTPFRRMWTTTWSLARFVFGGK